MPIQRDVDGLWQGTGFFLGAVLLARRGERVLLVRKASRPGYAFSGMWALPGGRVRGGGVLAEGLESTVRQRLAAEAGVVLQGGLVALPGQPPLSRYVRDGRQHATLVLPLTGRVQGEPVASDDSITEARFVEPTGLWRQIAPANRVILGSALWGELDGIQRAAARGPLQSAWEDCAMWAAMLRLPPPPEPWSRS